MNENHVAATVRAELARKGKTQADVSEVLGITRQGVSRRMLGSVDFKVSELYAIAQLCEIPVTTLIPDASNVA